MKFRNLSIGTGLALAFLLCLAVDSNTFAQGRGRGGGRPAGAGQPTGTGVDRGLGTASTKSNGRSDDGLDRARARRNNSASSLSDHELNRYRGLSRKLGITPEQMRANYLAAVAANPNLKYGQFVAANVIADNLNARHPAITSTAILAGLANGDSIGETLRNLRVPKDQARAAEKAANRRIKEAKNRN